MKVKVNDKQQFLAKVFGAECFIEYYPEILTTGIDVITQKRHGQVLHCVTKDGVNPVNDTAFFTEEEMLYLKEVK